MSKPELTALFEKIPMDKIDKRIMMLRYLEKAPITDIGDDKEVKLSESAVKARHHAVIRVISNA